MYNDKMSKTSKEVKKLSKVFDEIECPKCKSNLYNPNTKTCFNCAYIGD